MQRLIVSAPGADQMPEATIAQTFNFESSQKVN
jgi:hypothetical protein